MEVFATYDILDSHGNKVADGHKASFCLEDVECMPGASKRYECVGYSDQGGFLSTAADFWSFAGPPNNCLQFGIVSLKH